MVICFGTPLDYLEKLADKIKNCAKNFDEIEETLEVQYAVNGVSEKTRDFIVAVENAENGMRSHAEKGYRIAKGSKELEVIADLILHHHES